MAGNVTGAFGSTSFHPEVPRAKRRARGGQYRGRIGATLFLKRCALSVELRC